MKYTFSLILLLLPTSLFAQTSQDSTGIKNTALDYIEGWYTGDVNRMEQAIHPKLAKRIVVKDPRSDRNRLVQTSALELIQQTRRGGRKQYPSK